MAYSIIRLVYLGLGLGLGHWLDNCSQLDFICSGTRKGCITFPLVARITILILHVCLVIMTLSCVRGEKLVLDHVTAVVYIHPCYLMLRLLLHSQV